MISLSFCGSCAASAWEVPRYSSICEICFLYCAILSSKELSRSQKYCEGNPLVAPSEYAPGYVPRYSSARLPLSACCVCARMSLFSSSTEPLSSSRIAPSSVASSCAIFSSFFTWLIGFLFPELNSLDMSSLFLTTSSLIILLMKKKKKETKKQRNKEKELVLIDEKKDKKVIKEILFH